MTLYHFTCEHAYGRIGDAGELVPAYQLASGLQGWWPSRFVWLTDLAVCDMDALGFTKNPSACDHSTYRYRVIDETGCRKWTDVRRGLIRVRSVLEDIPGVRLRHWYVSPIPVPVVLDQRG